MEAAVELLSQPSILVCEVARQVGLPPGVALRPRVRVPLRRATDDLPLRTAPGKAQRAAGSDRGMSAQSIAVSQPAASTGREPILVVETGADFGRALVEQLAADGHPTDLARTARHAETLASASPPRLVVLGELDSPRGTLDLLEAIRGHHAEAWPQNLPVIVLSSRTTEPDMLRAFEAGADDFITRPARYLELRASRPFSRLSAGVRVRVPCASSRG
jgi:PleD family two-component response regulator